MLIIYCTINFEFKLFLMIGCIYNIFMLVNPKISMNQQHFVLKKKELYPILLIWIRREHFLYNEKKIKHKQKIK